MLSKVKCNYDSNPSKFSSIPGKYIFSFLWGKNTFHFIENRHEKLGTKLQGEIFLSEV